MWWGFLLSVPSEPRVVIQPVGGGTFSFVCRCGGGGWWWEKWNEDVVKISIVVAP
jgi:hypothetical protein